MRVFESGSILLYLADKFGVYPRSCRPDRMFELAVLADGRNTNVRRRVWSLLRLRTGKD